jgi:indolepyruvate ferredoxin oxidoreductase
VRALLQPAQVIQFKPRETLEALVARRVEFLTAYQNAPMPSSTAPSWPGARPRPRWARPRWPRPWRATFKLMAYKDEYEVARLHTDPALPASASMFEGDYKLRYHLAPPLLAKKNDRAIWSSRAMARMRKAFGCWPAEGPARHGLDPSAAPRSAAPSAP